MISYFFFYFLQKEDKEISMELSLDLILISAFCECLLFLEGICFFRLDAVWLNVLAALAGAVYFNVTAWVDLLTGYVYQYFNLFFGILFSLGTFIMYRSRFFIVIFFFFFLIFVKQCERANAFSRGDSEFLGVSYFYFTMGTGSRNGLEIMLMVMLLGSVFFGIFRKICGNKEGMIPYTPFLVFSEFIIMILLRLPDVLYRVMGI